MDAYEHHLKHLWACPCLCESGLLSKANCNFKTYVHNVMQYKFFKLELGMAEVIDLTDLICFNTDCIFA